MQVITTAEMSKFRDIDYRHTWLRIGAERNTSTPGGLMLNADDMRVLSSLLRARIPMGQEHGRTVFCEAATEASEALRLLAAWAEAGAEQLENAAAQESSFAAVH